WRVPTARRWSSGWSRSPTSTPRSAPGGAAWRRGRSSRRPSRPTGARVTPSSGALMKRLAIVLFVLSTGAACACYTVQPGNRGVKVTLGQVSETILPEGFGNKVPWSTVEQVSVRQQTRGVNATCFSSDLQQVNMQLKVLYRIPETSVVKVF